MVESRILLKYDVDEECPICMESMEDKKVIQHKRQDGEDFIHTFHFTCFKKPSVCNEKNGTICKCPLCRTKIYVPIQPLDIYKCDFLPGFLIFLCKSPPQYNNKFIYIFRYIESKYLFFELELELENDEVIGRCLHTLNTRETPYPVYLTNEIEKLENQIQNKNLEIIDKRLTVVDKEYIKREVYKSQRGGKRKTRRLLRKKRKTRQRRRK